MKMSSEPKRDVRPKRHVHPPGWLEDYEVTLPSSRQPPLHNSLSRTVQYRSDEEQPLFGQMEGYAEMTPLTQGQRYSQWSTATNEPSHQYALAAEPALSPGWITESTCGMPPSFHHPATAASPEVLRAIRQLQEENRRLQISMMDMKCRIEASTPLPSHPPQQVPRPQVWSLSQPGHLSQPNSLPVLAVKTGHAPQPLSSNHPPGGDHHAVQLDGEDWPPPPPPVVEHVPPSTQTPQVDLVNELTDRFCRLGQLPPPPSADHWEPDSVSQASDKPWRNIEELDRQNHGPPPHRPCHRECSSQRQVSTHLRHSPSPPRQERTYRGPKPTIPKFTKEDPREFARLKIALENILPEDATERFKYQVLIDHLKFEEALLIADSYSNSRYPYSDTMASLTSHYGQPHQLALQRIADLMDGPTIRSGDTASFKKFALHIRALVGMLDQLGEEGHIELQCGSHVARLTAKLPHDMRAYFKRYIHPLKIKVPTLLNLADWLEYELEIQQSGLKFGRGEGKESTDPRKDRHKDFKLRKTATILHGTEPTFTTTKEPALSTNTAQEKVKAYCPYCNNSLHYLDQCSNFSHLTKEQKSMWVKSNKKCWRCGRGHQAAQCRLKVTCKICKGKHVEVLHDLNRKPVGEDACHASPASDILYLDRRAGCSQVLLKITKVVLRHRGQILETYAILDDGSERTILLQAAAKKLGLRGTPEELALRTVRQDIRVLHGSAVSFTISPASQPHSRFKIKGAFTADELGLAEHTQSVAALQRKYKHLRGLPLQSLDRVCPLLLIGSDYPQLITPIEPVRLGPPGGPAAVNTKLGWTIQGPTKYIKRCISSSHCLLTSTHSPSEELSRHVERLWQLDMLPYRSEKLVTRSKRDQQAVNLLEAKTVRVNVNGVQRYATPLLRVKDMPRLQAPKEAMLANLRSVERRLAKDPEKAAVYIAEVQKLEQAGYIVKVPSEMVYQAESWYIPHHIVHHNGKNRLVFNCSFKYQGENLNELLLPGPTLSSTLLGVLLRFREHSVAVSSDIKAMFHQVRLLPKDKSLLRFLWRDLKTEDPPSVYEWQVLPFGTTCSPCCATYALQTHVINHSLPGEDVREAVERCFYVDNHLQSLSSIDEAKKLVDKLKALLATGGFELRQWVSNTPEVISHLPKEARAESSELWLSQDQAGADPQEQTLGLRWSCQSDTLGYKHRLQESPTPTMRNIYRVLASQYDPLGFIVPYTTRAKVLVQRLWDKHRQWDDPLLPSELLQTWNTWEEELEHLPLISFPRCYASTEMDLSDSVRDVHIFCDASERAYGSVAYLRTEDSQGQVQVAFLTARSRVAPKRQQSMPRLELCAAVTAAQLATLLERELTLPLRSIVLWSDSTTVLTWLQSESCRYKVFVGTRVTEIQELTDTQAWRYVDSASNPADDLTRGLPLQELATENRWSQGPAFLRQSSDHWPTKPVTEVLDDLNEVRKPTFCALSITCIDPALPDLGQFSSFRELIEATALSRHGAAGLQGSPSAEAHIEAEREILRKAQEQCFPEDLKRLLASKPVSSTSRLLTLAPEYDESTKLIRVGGRLRRSDHLEPDTVHPIVLDPAHPVTKLIIQDTDNDLRHPGSERLFAEIRRRYWILRGREAIKRQQRTCVECQRWRAKPTVPKMSDLPQSRLRLYQPAFTSTGVDCFGPLQVKVGRRNEKRWGILFKCMTTRAVHIELLSSLDSDSFLMALRRFIARRGKPAELLSDQGTNFKGGDRELQEAFRALHPTLQAQLAKNQIKFKFNPPSAPHFGGVWEREIRSIKSALNATVKAQTVTEEVLNTVLIEVEGILNSKPLGYVSTDVADPEPITPNLLLMGRLDPALPQAVYLESELLGRRRWRHCQVLADQFWRHFVRHYLTSLQTRSKWWNDSENLQLDTVVLVIDPQLPRALWPVGRVSKTLPGADGRIRTAEVTIGGKTYLRPVARLIKLPAIPDEDMD